MFAVNVIFANIDLLPSMNASRTGKVSVLLRIITGTIKRLEGENQFNIYNPSKKCY